MPTSPAYARTLLRRGSARRLSHPTLTILQLTHVVPKPTLRPIVLGVRLHGGSAHLVLVIDHAHSPPTSIHIVVDLQQGTPWFGQQRRTPLRSLVRRVHRSRQKRTQLHRLDRRSPTISTTHWRGKVLAAVITLLQELLPISQLLVRSSAQQVDESLSSTYRIEHYIANLIVSSKKKGAPVDSAPGQQATLLASLYQVLDAIGTKQQLSTPHYVVCYSYQPKGILLGKRQSRIYQDDPIELMSWSLSMQVSKRMSSDMLGHVCTIRHERRKITGIIIDQFPDHRLVLYVPIHRDAMTMAWTKVPVAATTSRQIWEHMSLLLLRIIKE